MKQTYQVTVSDAPSYDRFGGSRSGSWHFTTARGAEAFRALLLKKVFGLSARASRESCDDAGAYIDITPVPAFRSRNELVSQGYSWPFDELTR